jgi:superfamily II DNA or RNA helicase
MSTDMPQPPTRLLTVADNGQHSVSQPKPTREQVHCCIRQCAMKVFQRNLHDEQVHAIYNLITYNLLLLSLKTGSGKSTVMQVTGCLLRSITLVIVPLLVLEEITIVEQSKDVIESLRRYASRTSSSIIRRRFS